MRFHFQKLMRQASMLTQAGDLGAATAAIQAALRGQSADAHRLDDSDIIDVQATEIFPTLAPRVAAAADEDACPPIAPVVQGDTFIAGKFRNSAGLRDYKLYVPPSHGESRLPLVVMLHGCTQDADDFAAGTAMNEAARKQGFYVLYPVQSRKANPQKCWNWFKHNHQERDRGEPSILSEMTREVIATHAIDPQRVYVAGLSAGGAMAAILAGLYPDLYAAAGVHSGLAAGAAKDLPTALSAMKGSRPGGAPHSGSGIPTIVFHGDRDSTVHPANAASVIAAATGSGTPMQTASVPGKAHARSSTVYTYRDSSGGVIAERWEVHGGAHAWSGGSQRGSYTDPSGPSASAEMLRFFFERSLPGKA